MQKVDALVLGAGIVGISTALQLQARHRNVILVDRHANAGLETSFGNAGLIERSSIFPYFFPNSPSKLLKYALNLAPEAHYHFSALPEIFPWIFRYFIASRPEGVARSFAAFRPLIENSLTEHTPLLTAARAEMLIRRSGWIKLFRYRSTFDAGAKEAQKLRNYGLAIDILDTNSLHQREPVLSPAPGALHFLDTASISDPGALSKAYAELFIARGGRLVQGDALSLERSAEGWRVQTAAGPVTARDAIVALGPWSDEIFRPLGYKIPLGVKRGYHVHFAAKTTASLSHPVLDADNGFLLAPMTRGVRLTTGAEFARRDAAATPKQISRCEPLARQLAPLGARLDHLPWLGARPCLPDMLPVLGPAPRHPGLWFNFGHAHHGLTLGPITGRLLAELMIGAPPLLDVSPYRADRF